MPEVNNGGGRMTQGYTPVDYNPSEIMPDAKPGKYGGTITRVAVKPNQKTGFPQLSFTHRIETEESGIEDNEQFVGSEVQKVLVLFPDRDRRSGMGKRDLQNLCDAVGIDMKEYFSGRIQNPEQDLKDFMEAVTDQHLTFWVTSREVASREDATQTRVFLDLHWAEPRNFAQLVGLSDVEEEEEEPAPPPPKTSRAATKTAATKPAKRR